MASRVPAKTGAKNRQGMGGGEVPVAAFRPGSRLKSIVNPSQGSLDALLAARKQFPCSDSSLHYDPAISNPMIVSTFLYRAIHAPSLRVCSRLRKRSQA